jgi:hypothetical protein
MDALLGWIEGTPGGRSYVSPRVEVRDDPAWGRGVCTVAPVAARELVVRIAPSLLLNYTTVVRHICRYSGAVLPAAYAAVWVPEDGDEDGAEAAFYRRLALGDLTALSLVQLVSLYLCLEARRGAASFWAPFIAMLPPMSDFAMVPLVWQVLATPERALVEALPPAARQHAQRVLARFEQDYAAVARLVDARGGPAVTAAQYVWAWMCVNLRCLYMDMPQRKSKHDNLTMAPYVDFLNHASDDECTLAVDLHGFLVYSGRAYGVGEQVFLSYGPHLNAFLLCEYGFVLSDNKWDDVDVTPQLARGMLPRQRDFLEAEGYWGDYTISASGVSFRTEVALATMLEPAPEALRRLRALLDGVADGAAYARRSRTLLAAALEDVLRQCDRSEQLCMSIEACARCRLAVMQLHAATRRIVSGV